MSSHGGPRHALEPNPKHHDAGEPAVDRRVIEQELRDQQDPAVRAQRMRDYLFRTGGQSLYDRSGDVRSQVARHSSIAVTAMDIKASESFAIVNETLLEDRQQTAGMAVDGGEPLLASLRITLSAARVSCSAESLRRLSSTISSHTGATNSCSGIAATGSPSAEPVTPARQLEKTAASATRGGDQSSHMSGLTWLGCTRPCANPAACGNSCRPLGWTPTERTPGGGRGGESLDAAAAATGNPGAHTRRQNSRGGV